jgi:hypothetical protein
MCVIARDIDTREAFHRAGGSNARG